MSNICNNCYPHPHILPPKHIHRFVLPLRDIFLNDNSMKIKQYFTTLVALCVASVAFSSCDDEETYAEQKEKERKAIDGFLKRPLTLVDGSGDILVDMGKRIEVIPEWKFIAQDSTTDVQNNEFVLFTNSGVYMQIVRKGPGSPIRSGETKRIITRYFEYNILGDSLQSTSLTPYWATNPDILSAANTSGSVYATFDTSLNGGGPMYLIYKTTSVPEGWLVPLSYVNLGRQRTEHEGIAKVRLIVPHHQGHTDATKGVYPCFYEITYQEMRE